MVTVNIPIKDARKPPTLNFPDRCVNCGSPKARSLPLKLATGAQKRGQMMQLELAVPLCMTCGTREDRIGNVTWLPFFLVGILTFIGVFIPVSLIAPEGTNAQTLGLPYVLAAAAGLAAGIAFGTVAELILKILYAPAYGQLLLKRPITLVSVFNDSEQVIGLSAKWRNSRTNLELTFANDSIAHEFIDLNPQETS